MPDLPRVEEAQRVDLTELEDLLEVPLLFDEAQGDQFFTAPTNSSNHILRGFQLTNLVSKQLRVDLGAAFLSTRERNIVRKGRLTFEGDTNKIIDLTAFANGTYGVWVRFQYSDGVFQNRVFWNDVTDVEFAKNIATRRVANWGLSVQATSPGADWLQIGSVEVLASPPLNIRRERSFFFEGPEFSPLSPTNEGTAATLAAPSGTTMLITGVAGFDSFSVGRYIQLEGCADNDNNTQFLIRAQTGTTVTVIVPSGFGGGSDANNGSIIWTESESYIGHSSALSSPDRAENGLTDLYSWVQFVNYKLEQIQGGTLGSSQEEYYRRRRRWDSPLTGSLDDQLPLSGATAANFNPLRGPIEVDLDDSRDLGTASIRFRDIFSRNAVFGGAGGLTVDGGDDLNITGGGELLIANGLADEGMAITGPKPRLLISDTTETIASLRFQDDDTVTQWGEVNYDAANNILALDVSTGGGVVRVNNNASVRFEVADTRVRSFVDLESGSGATLGVTGARWPEAYFDELYLTDGALQGVMTDMIPGTTNSVDLGNITRFFQTLFVQTIHPRSGSLLPGAATHTLGSSLSGWATTYLYDELHFLQRGARILWDTTAGGPESQPLLSVTNTPAQELAIDGRFRPTTNGAEDLGGASNYWGAIFGAALQIGASGAGYVDPGAGGGAIEVRWGTNGAAIKFQRTTGATHAFDFGAADGTVIVASGIGGSQDRKIAVDIGGTTYYIPLHTA